VTAAIVQIKADPRTAKEIATDLFDELARATGDGVGITRECYAEGENRAIDIYRTCAEAFGLRTSVDAGANLLVTLPGDDGAAPGIIVGSHADSVPQGGNYDGAAGVIAGLLCLIRLRREGIEPPAPVRCLIMRGEESAFYGRANIGSRALFGLLEAKDLAAKSRGVGRSLRDAMASVGADVDRIGRGEPLFDAGSALAYLELHIEQGR
jgi:N-carbamoyl-L-amino-acid hydrolase